MTDARALVLLVLLVFTGLLAPTPARAHGRDTSHSRWQVEGEQVEVALRVSGRDYARAGGAAAIVATIRVAGSTLACTPELASLDERPLASGDRLLRWRFDCAGVPAPRTIELDLFELLGPAHVHLLARADDAREQVLTSSERRASLDPQPRGDPAPALAFVRLGVVHMLGGADHLAFVLALLLGARRLGRVAALVTGFTIGHSLTLALVALDRVRPHTGAVELLIAASLVIVAAQDFGRRAGGVESGKLPEQVAGMLALAALLATIRGQASAVAAWGASLFAWGYLRRAPRELGVAFVAGFGLIHGAGFATILLDAGLPSEARVGALLAFNLGVELGGLAFVALAWPVLTRLRRHGDALERALALVIAGLGTAWVVTRAGWS